MQRERNSSCGQGVRDRPVEQLFETSREISDVGKSGTFPVN